jgi:hypothetical protein
VTNGTKPGRHGEGETRSFGGCGDAAVLFVFINRQEKPESDAEVPTAR